MIRSGAVTSVTRCRRRHRHVIDETVAVVVVSMDNIATVGFVTGIHDAVDVDVDVVVVLAVVVFGVVVCLVAAGPPVEGFGATPCIAASECGACAC